MVQQTAHRGNYRWNPDQDAFLQSCFNSGMSPGDMTVTLNDHFETKFTTRAISCRAGTLGLRRPRRCAAQWTESMNDALRTLVANGGKQADIAIELKVPFGSVASQMTRLDIRHPRPNPAAKLIFDQADSIQTSRDEHIRRRINAWKFNAKGPPVHDVAPLPAKPDVVTDPLNLTLAEVVRGQCHWITNDDPAAPLYCGHGTGGHGSWCPPHQSVVIRPTDHYDEKVSARIAQRLTA